MSRTLSAILKDADKAQDLERLSSIWTEIVNNRRSFPLIELDFAKEHLSGLAGKMGSRDGKVMAALLKQLLNQ